MHIGRSFDGPGHVEATCPCPLAPCGLVDTDDVDEACEQHPPTRCKTIRTGHPADACPGTGRAVVVAMGKTEAAHQAVIDAAAMGESAGTVNFSLFGALDDYRAAVEHEAAERIREDSWSRRDRWGRYENEQREAGQCHGADLIDPEVP
ncbi:hypothetical protein ACIQMR_35280 [Streptomyces sp. NPDC091376]|uniref:hypothetical protein n=1 Tax=Streptomyces sp. NPDC091376 TaxID=3365994 RepID=UPI003822DC0C